MARVLRRLRAVGGLGAGGNNRTIVDALRTSLAAIAA